MPCGSLSICKEGKRWGVEWHEWSDSRRRNQVHWASTRPRIDTRIRAAPPSPNGFVSTIQRGGMDQGIPSDFRRPSMELWLGFYYISEVDCPVSKTNRCVGLTFAFFIVCLDISLCHTGRSQPIVQFLLQRPKFYLSYISAPASFRLSVPNRRFLRQRISCRRK
jgi:hypothetical protein